MLWAAVLSEDTGSMIAGYGDYARGLDRAHVWLGKTLREIDETGTSVLVIGDAGAVPYYSGWQTIDSFGLNNPHIGRNRDYSPEFVFSQIPSVVVLLSRSPETFDPILPWEADHHSFLTDQGMEKLCTLKFRDRYYLWAIGYPDSPQSQQLVTRCRENTPTDIHPLN